ncbi:MAG: CDP-alcohol phosphatidyltransferase family protein [Bacteroidales bacterium]|jgi:CDP-diacylglycerol--serine O-phosphatidyltransferase|nr:CDP-alcohol phosphatidyltransferase family protein [Bacteroidales bacterium]MBR3065658.1 CDP-alcohol phosphatidyltransferase family protein [Bacteroidales bacterium]
MKKHIPNLLTLCNLLSGCTGVVFAVRGNFSAVLICLLLSEVFDFFDGFSARALGAYSEIGKQLDSLADLISFGLCPSVCLFSWYGIAHPEIPLLRWLPFLLTAASALRLAKFNIDTRQSTSFLGLATSGCALLLIPLAVYSFYTDGFLHILMGTVWFIPVLTLVFSFLLVCELPMFSLKKMTGQLKAFIIGSLILIIACLIREIRGPWYVTVSLCVFLVLVYYLVLNLATLKRR